MLRGKLRKTALLCAGKVWEDTDFDCMKMGAYCKDLQEEAANKNLQIKPIQCIRNVRLWQESWEVPKRYGGKGSKLLEAWLEKKYIGLKLNEMEGDWMNFTIDTIELDRCCNKKFPFRAVMKSYNDDLEERDDENYGNMHIMHSVRKHIYALLNITRTIRMKAVLEFSCQMMTVTVRIQAMNGNMWEQVKQGRRQWQRKQRKLKRRLQQGRRRGGMGDSGDRVMGGEDTMMGAR
jgi:hypothetical protein